MLRSVDKLYVIKRPRRIQILFYCPECESVNELESRQDLTCLRCRDCRKELDGSEGTLEVIVAKTENGNTFQE